MLKDYMKNIKFLKGEIYIHTCRGDYSRAGYWLGIAIALGFDIPEDVSMPIINATWNKLHLDNWLKAYNLWN